MIENIVYDVSREAASGALMFLSFLAINFLVCGTVLSSIAGKCALNEGKARMAGAISLCVCAAFVYAGARGLQSRHACAAALHAGQFSTTSGRLASLEHLGGKRPSTVAFTLGGERFVSQGASNDACGVAPSPSSRFKFADGQFLRIDHQGERILRVTLLDAAHPAAAGQSP